MSCHRTIIRLSAVLAGVALAWSCGGDDSPTVPPTPEPARPTTVTVAPATPELAALGATVQLRAAVRDQSSAVMAGATVTWTSSASSVATVDASGLVTAAGNGTATITASAGSASGSAVVTVTQSVASVEVSPSVDELTALGATVQLTAEAFDANGHAVAGAEFSWESSDVAVATVDESGLVTGVSKGVATITARAGDASGSAVVSVMQPVASVEVSPSVETIGLGSTLQLTAEGFDENGDAVAGVAFSWESSDVAVATVDASGLVTGVAEGTVTVTAAAGDASGASEITVGNPDRAALVALYNATDGPNWVNSENWLTDSPLGDWYGVDTDGSGRVVRLDLGGRWDSDPGQSIHHGLVGSIPSEIGSLSRLTYLSLGDNDLTGPIPPELGNLANLTELWLDDNELSGPIPPELGNLANLTGLYLGNNILTGPIPPELGNLANLTWLYLFDNVLTGPIPPELGNLANLTSLYLIGNALTGPIPPEFGKLANLKTLQLGNNALTGPIPPELGDLANLTWLYLAENDLHGPIPQSFLQLARLRDFRIQGNESLCVPGTSAFVEWLRGIDNWDDSESLCNATDVAALKSLYETTGGTAWTESDGWSSDGAVEEWHGVTADSLGRVTVLDLAGNGLAGEFPSSMGGLAQMTELRIGGNANLSGRLPLSFARLSLRELHYAGTKLCELDDASFQAWLNTILSHEGTGVECAPLSDREILEVFYHATGGPDWTNADNWLTNAPLRQWHGVYTDSEGRVTELSLFENNMTGAMPPELGFLTRLETLSFAQNRELSGPIPPQLGNLARLETMRLQFTDLTGPIPPELGLLSELTQLNVWRARLSGSIPPELGSLANLAVLALGENQLTGPIPPELGNLRNLQRLYLVRNALTGPLPHELGNLSELELLSLDQNDLTGSIPPELGRLANLKELGVANNARMSGVLPESLTALRQLDAFTTGGTGLCAPFGPAFQVWLAGIHKRRVAICDGGDAARAYLVQSVQSRHNPVPLVAGEQALLRVFPTAQRATHEGIPAVRARFYVNGHETHVEDIPGKAEPIPTELDEGDLMRSANAVIPGHLVQPGLEMVIEVDPAGTLDLALGVAKRIPETGRLAVEVRAMPTLDLTVVPFLWTVDPDSEILDITSGMAADPENHEMLWATRTLLPVGDLEVRAHEPVLSTTNNASVLGHVTEGIRLMEGGTGHYMAMMSGDVDGPFGFAVGNRLSFARPSAPTIAHELGHNMDLSHAPCGGASGLDAGFPYPDGSIGVWGYDFEGSTLVWPGRPDLMGYCGPSWWISDYHFTNALRYRLVDEGTPEAAVVAQPTRSLLLWGGLGADSVPFLEPAFVVEAPAALPDSAGAHRLIGRAASGAELFSLSFTMPETADGDGSSSFAFVLPVRPGWEGNLASITLDGPGGSVTLDGESDSRMAILLNPRSGQVRGILRDLPPPTQAARDAAGRTAGPGLEVLISRGIPDAAAWRR